MFFRQFTVSLLAFSAYGSASALSTDEVGRSGTAVRTPFADDASRNQNPAPAVIKRACQPMCCAAVVASINPSGKIGIGCHPGGGEDCDFDKLLKTCCDRLVPVRLH
jgi:hypothetical protein